MVLGTDEPFEAICPYAMAAPLAPSVAADLEGRRLDPARRRRGATGSCRSATTW